MDIEIDEQKWEEVLKILEKRFGKKPDLQSIIFLIGHRELGQLREKFSKEEKQDLIHVGVCVLLAQAGYYAFVSNDAQGWPHFEPIRGKEKMDGEAQEIVLKREIISYFDKL